MSYQRKEISPEEIQRQETICRHIFDRVTADGRRPLAMVDTYGCQQNEADSEKLRGYLAEMGFGWQQPGAEGHEPQLHPGSISGKGRPRPAVHAGSGVRPPRAVALPGAAGACYDQQKAGLCHREKRRCRGGGHPPAPGRFGKGMALHHVRLQQFLHLLHRALRPGSGAVPPTGGCGGGGAEADRGGVSGHYPSGAERELLRQGFGLRRRFCRLDCHGGRHSRGLCAALYDQSPQGRHREAVPDQATTGC